MGTLTAYIETVLEGGPKALRAANKEAQRLSERYGVRVDPQWLLLTPWLDTVFRYQGIENNDSRYPHRSGNGRFCGEQRGARVTRNRVRYALSWRARFLAAYACTASITAACRIAKVGHRTVELHYREDKDFAVQVDQARAHAIDLLHTRVMQRALEGDLEPVYWQGVVVDHVRKFSDRLQIELLRAHMPNTFKTPGVHGGVNVHTGDQILVMDEETRAKIIEARRRALNARTAAFCTGGRARVGVALKAFLLGSRN